MEHMQWDEADLPDGFISHYACPTDDGLYVFDVWESPEDFDRFFHARLSGAMAASLGEVPAIEPRFLPVHNVSHATSRV